MITALKRVVVGVVNLPHAFSWRMLEVELFTRGGCLRRSLMVVKVCKVVGGVFATDEKKHRFV